MQAPIQPRTYCYDEPAKLGHSKQVRRFYRAALKQLPDFELMEPIRFNPGGIAVWGETYFRATMHGPGLSYVEAYDTHMGILVRQWDGRNSGRNHYVQTLEDFVKLVRELVVRPFVRF